MNIKVWDDKYVIKSDPLCYKLYAVKTRQPKDDEETTEEVNINADGTYEVAIGYVNTVAQCFRLIYEREGRANKCSTLDGYIKHLEKLDKQFETNMKQFNAVVGGQEKVKDILTRLATAK